MRETLFGGYDACFSGDLDLLLMRLCDFLVLGVVFGWYGYLVFAFAGLGWALVFDSWLGVYLV